MGGARETGKQKTKFLLNANEALVGFKHYLPSKHKV